MTNAELQPQGGSVSQALESVLKASHIILKKNVQTGVGSQMMMHSSIFRRLGMAASRSSYCVNGIDCGSNIRC